MQHKKIISTVSDPIKPVDILDGLISNNEADKIVNEEKIFNFSEKQFPELAAQEAAYFDTDEIKNRYDCC